MKQIMWIGMFLLSFGVIGQTKNFEYLKKNFSEEDLLRCMAYIPEYASLMLEIIPLDSLRDDYLNKNIKNKKEAKFCYQSDIPYLLDSVQKKVFLEKIEKKIAQMPLQESQKQIHRILSWFNAMAYVQKLVTYKNKFTDIEEETIYGYTIAKSPFNFSAIYTKKAKDMGFANGEFPDEPWGCHCQADIYLMYWSKICTLSQEKQITYWKNVSLALKEATRDTYPEYTIQW